MGYPANWITLLLVSACTLVVHGQGNTQTRIPDHLIDCYRNQSLRHPENRPPMNMQTFIDIVSKVERFQRGTVNIAELAVSILHSFRLDGIERNPGVIEAEGVLPFAVSGFAFYKHRLILRYLVPANTYQFPNESLSQVELCTLHFMLSHTFDATQRGDEAQVCGTLSNYESENRMRRHARFRRQAEGEEAAANAAEEQKSEEANSDLTKDAEHILVDDTEKGLQGSAENSENTSKHVPKDTDESKEAAQQGDKSDATLNEHAEVVNQTANGNGTKSGNYIFEDETPPQNSPHQKARNVVDPETDIDVEPPVPATAAQSDCPVEGGAVHTRWGTVSLGAVLAGIGAGMFPQDVPVNNLVQRTTAQTILPPDMIGTTIDNRQAATLVGDLAEAALVRGPTSNIKIGRNGVWNSTIAPRWYFNTERDGREMTDAEIRGGLDGLVMGTNIEAWRQRVPGDELRLSHLLSMYYSEDGVIDPRFRACQRRDSYTEVAPNDRLVEQTYRFAVILDIQAITTASVTPLQIRSFAGTAVRMLSSYIPGMNNGQCPVRPNTPISTSLFTNVTVVIDRNWPFEDIKALLYQLALQLELSEFGSRLTVLNGRNLAAFITDAMFSVDVDMNFTRSQYESHEVGLDIPRALEQELQRSNEALLNAESENRLAGGRSTIILFIPFTPVSLSDNDLTIARERISHFRRVLPDVRFLYFAPGSRDNYRELVDNVQTDVITFDSLRTDAERITAINQVTDRIRQVQLRLFNPTCGANWQGQNYENADFVHSVPQRGVKYHRLHPNYFFGVGSGRVTVLGSNTQDLTVCHSRSIEFPVETTSEVTCAQTQNGNFEIRLENACEGTDLVSQCRPLYISVRPTGTNTPQTFSCANGCRNPTEVQYTIRNQGLGCTAGVGHLLSNPQFIFLTVALIFLTKYLKVGS